MRSGYVSVLAAYAVWGLLPVYWKQLSGVSPSETLMHRILWACALSWIALALAGRGRGALRALREPRVLRATAASAALIGVNWHIYVSAVAAGRIVEASLGYYITPLVSIVLGLLFLRERMSRLQAAAAAMAAAAVVYLTAAHGRFPWISVSLAATFGLYGLAKKTSPLDSVTGLALESLFLLPLAGGYVVYLAAAGGGAFGRDAPLTALLVGAGVLTAIPLWVFAEGAQRIPLKSVGFLQYLLPTLMLLVGTVVYGEPFDRTRGLAFGLIWLALALYSVTLVAGRGPAEPAARAAAVRRG
jgi:chloramphenicol-sensitive protein RarD